MEHPDHKRPPHIPGHESHGVHLCHKCGWPFPNPHPSAKHRRAHKRICGTVEGYKLFDPEGHAHSNASDDSDDDHKTTNMPGPNSSEIGKSEKGGGEIGEKINRSEDEVFTDAVADFSDSGLSSDSAISVERLDRKDSKFSEPSEDKVSDAADVSQSIIKTSDDFQMHSPEDLQSEGVEVQKTPELQGRAAGTTLEPLSTSDSDLRTEASTIVDSDDLLDLPSNSHPSRVSKAEAASDVIPETGENVADFGLTCAAEETNLKGKDGTESNRDMGEILDSSDNFVDGISGGLPKVEVSDKVTSDGEVADGVDEVVKLKEKNSVQLSSAVPHDGDSVVNTNDCSNVVQVESEHLLQPATSSDLVKASQEEGEGNVNVYALPNFDLAHSQSELEDCKFPEEVVLKDPLTLHSSEVLNHEEYDLKETVIEESHSSFNSNQLSEDKEVVSPDIHVLDESINRDPIVEVIAEAQADVSLAGVTVDGDQRSREIGASEDSLKSERNKTYVANLSEEPESDDVGKSSQKINLMEGSVSVTSDYFDCEEVLQNPSDRQSSEALKVKEEDLKDNVNEESHLNFMPSQLSNESEVFSDDNTKEDQVHCEPKLEDTPAEEQADFSSMTLAAESNQKADETGASMNDVSSKINESHVVQFDDVFKTSQERSFTEDSVVASSYKDPRDVSVGSSTSQTSVISIGNISQCGNNGNGIDDVAVVSQGGCNEESNIGIGEETVLPSDLLQLEAKTSIDVFNNDTQDKGDSKDTSLLNSGSSQFESSVVSEDMMDGYVRNSTVIDSENIDSASGTTEDVRGDGINNNSKVLEESNKSVGTFSTSHQTLIAELSLKAVENHASELSSHSPLNIEQRAQSASAIEDNPVVEPSGEASESTSVMPAQDQSSDNLVEFGTSGIDASVDEIMKEGIKIDEINNNSKAQEESNKSVATVSTLNQAQNVEPSLKAVESHVRELSSPSPNAEQQYAQSVPAVDASGQASETSVVPAQDRGVNNLVKFGSSGIDASVYSSSRCDSLEGNWGSVSVLSVQSDAPAVIDGEALPLTEAGKSNLNSSKATPEGQRSEKSEMFEHPSFMTLVEPGHVVGPKASASEVHKGHQQLPDPTASQAGWFPTITQVVNESQGRKKNEEIIAKVTNWSNGKQHTPLKSLLGEAANSSNKPKSPKFEENQASLKNGNVPKDIGSGLTTVNSILGPDSPANQAVVEGDAGKEWNSPARYPAGLKREKRKVKNRPYWVQFVCCTSVDSQ